mmetsp:Transcript_16578/g.31319  ORF Transcript_16578/g.31319 Transcript_16578/m.31319 type:complete len:288 (+) Transcript_16578:64-927(+)
MGHMSRLQKNNNTEAPLTKEKQTLFVGQFRKTKMCRFHETGRCRYGDQCPFAHDPSELEELPDLRKTSICKNWQQGCCAFSAEQCSFAHGKEELRKTPPFGRKKFPQDSFTRKDSFEGSGSDAYASTSDGYRSGSGYIESDRQSSSSLDDEPPSPVRQLRWDPLGMTAEVPTGCVAKAPYLNNNIDLDQRWRGGSGQPIADGISAPMRNGFDMVAMPNMLSMQRADTGCMIEGGMVPALPGHFVLMPAMAPMPAMPQPVMWEGQQYAPSGKELEEMLKKAMPTHYDD